MFDTLAFTRQSNGLQRPKTDKQGFFFIKLDQLADAASISTYWAVGVLQKLCQACADRELDRGPADLCLSIACQSQLGVFQENVYVSGLGHGNVLRNGWTGRFLAHASHSSRSVSKLVRLSLCLSSITH